MAKKSNRPGLRKLAKNRLFDELEEACISDIEADSVNAEELVSVLTLTSHRAEPEFTESLVWLSLTAFTERHGPAVGLELAHEIAPITPTSDTLREEIAGLYLAVHPDREDAPRVIEQVLMGGEEIPEAMRRTDALIRIAPGTYLRERAGRERAKSGGLSEDGAHLVAHYEEGPQEIPLVRAPDLVSLPPDDFGALRLFEKDRLNAMATEDPVGLVERCVRAFGPRLTYRELRAALMPVLDNWNTWWNQVRPMVSRSVWIDMSAAAQPVLELRKIPLSHDARVKGDLAEAEFEFDKLAITFGYLDEAGDHAAEETELVQYLADVAAEIADIDDNAVALAGAGCWWALAQIAPDALAGKEAPEADFGADSSVTFVSIPDPRFQRAVLGLVREREPEKALEFAATAIPALDPAVADEVCVSLREAGREDLVLDAAERILASPGRFHGAFIWLFREISAGRLPEDEGGPDRVEVLCQTMLAVDRTFLDEDPESKKLSLKIRNALSSRNFTTARDILSKTDQDGAERVREALDRCFRLTDDFRAKLSDILTETHFDLFVKILPPWELEEVVYTTREGQLKKQEELNDLVNNVLPGIAEAIGRAAALGDLSENAEYSAALEQRERMTERANVLQTDLKNAKVIPDEMPGTLEVTVGSKVEVKNLDSGELQTLTFLGPWDVDVENGIFSYRAPLSLSFMGKKKDEIVEFTIDGGSKRFRVLSISSGL